MIQDKVWVFEMHQVLLDIFFLRHGNLLDLEEDVDLMNCEDFEKIVGEA